MPFRSRQQITNLIHHHLILKPYERWIRSPTRQFVRAVGFIVYAFVASHFLLILSPLWYQEPRPDPQEVAAERAERRRERLSHLSANREGLRRTLSFTQGHVQQPDSSFLTRLPLELRHEIYKLVLTGRNKHFLRLGSNEEEQATDFVMNRTDYRTHDTSSLPAYYKEPWGKSQMLALPLTCRQIYLESIDLVYSSAVFKVSRLFTLRDLHMTLLPQRFEAIRSLELTYEFRCGLPMMREPAIREDSDWELFWNIMAKHMKGLRELRIDLFQFDVGSLIEGEDSLVDSKDERWTWLRHMLQVNRLGRCTARLHSAGKVNLVHNPSPPVSVYMLMVMDSLERLISSAMAGKPLDPKAPVNLPNDGQVESIWSACRQLGA